MTQEKNQQVCNLIDFRIEVIFEKIWEHRIIRNTLENYTTNSKKRDRMEFLTHRLPIFLWTGYGVCFLSFLWEDNLCETGFEDNIKKFTNRFITYLRHANTGHIVTVSFIWIKLANNYFNTLCGEVKIPDLLVCYQRKEWG